MQIKTISSPLWYVARIFITFWIIGWSVGLTNILLGKVHMELHGMSLADAKLLFFAAWVIGLLVWYVLCVGLKKVSIDKENIYVSNFVRNAVIPFSSIADVLGAKASNLVTIRFKVSNVFGKQVTFVAKPRLGFSLQHHPIVAELKKLARLEK